MRKIQSQARLLSLSILLICIFLNGNLKAADQFSLVTQQPVQLSGYTNIRYQIRQDKIDGFDVRRARMSLKGSWDHGIRYKFQGEFGTSKQKLLDAAVSMKLWGLLLTAGQFTLPFSYENGLSSAKLATINRSQVVEAMAARSLDIIGNQYGRDAGFQVSGQWRGVNAAFGIFNGSGINTSDGNESKDLAGRLVFTPIKNISVGGSFYHGHYFLLGISDKRNRIGVELNGRWKILSFAGEYIRGEDADTRKDGWYAQGAWGISKVFQFVLKADRFDPSTDLTDNALSVYTAGVNVIVNEILKIQNNLEIKTEEGVKLNNDAFTTQLQIAF